MTFLCRAAAGVRGCEDDVPSAVPRHQDGLAPGGRDVAASRQAGTGCYYITAVYSIRRPDRDGQANIAIYSVVMLDHKPFRVLSALHSAHSTMSAMLSSCRGVLHQTQQSVIHTLPCTSLSTPLLEAHGFMDLPRRIDDHDAGDQDPHGVDDHEVEPEVLELWPRVHQPCSTWSALSDDSTCDSSQMTGLLPYQQQARMRADADTLPIL